MLNFKKLNTLFVIFSFFIIGNSLIGGYFSHDCMNSDAFSQIDSTLLGGFYFYLFLQFFLFIEYRKSGDSNEA